MNIAKINSLYAETLAKWYLRFNGYFTIENFIVHAGDDPTRISGGMIGNYTETDLLAIKHEFSREINGSLQFKTDTKLEIAPTPKIDFVIAEVKTGAQNKPNKVWQEKNLYVIEYIIRFVGIISTEKQISDIAKIISEKGYYTDPESNFSIRLILISEAKISNTWKHLTNILFEDIVNYLVLVRGICWSEANIGIASMHQQWDPLINELFKIANKRTLTESEKKTEIKALLYRND